MKKVKFNYKYLLISLSAATVISATAIGLYSTLSNPTQSTSTTINQNLQAISTDKIGQQVGNIRHWQNNSFNGIEVKNGGFAVLTGTQSATRIDAFGNILWEFDPQSLSSDSNYVDFNNKKVVEIVQDEGSNANVLYLLLIPKDAPDELKDTDPTDASYYSSMTGTGTSAVSKQATIVQITENINSYSGSTWTPSFVINKHINIDPKKMVDNYPSSWTTTTDSSTNTFFAQKDHPSWYVSSSGQKVSNVISENNNLNSTMVLPWKQYITNLGNMYAKDGILFMFGGNGSIYNDPEALSIGMWKLDFTLESNNCIGIPYAYLLKNLSYEPAALEVDITIWNWNKSYAPIGQTDDFNYVPRLAVGGIQTNASGNEQTYLYLAGAITVGQVTNSQTRQEVDSSGNLLTKTQNEYTALNLQDMRSLQLTGANTINNPQNPTANSIDPALLFGTAFNIQNLMNLSFNTINNNNLEQFNNVLMDNNYFDVGATQGISATYGTYYFFNKGSVPTSDTNATKLDGWEGMAAGSSSTYQDQSLDPSVSAHRRSFLSPFLPTDLTNIGEVKLIKSNNRLTAGDNTFNNDYAASYSYTMILLMENARNYYYPTLAFGYSLKNVGSLTKVKASSEFDSKEEVYGYAMQVGSAVVYLNEPKFNTNSIVFHGTSIVSIGNQDLLGEATYGGSPYAYSWNTLPTTNYYPYSFTGYTQSINNFTTIGVNSFVRGIKEFNDTVPYIADGWKISNDPYGDGTSRDGKAVATKSPNLSWNDFVGLSASNEGSNLLSLWDDKTSSRANGQETFILTSTPQIPEYDLKTINTWSNIPSSATNTNSIVKKGSRKVWFSQPTSISGSGTASTRIINSTATEANYFVNQNPQDNSSKAFDTVIETRDDSSINYFFGQLDSASSGSGISYRDIENSYGVNYYSTISSIDRNETLGSGMFLNNLSNNILMNSLSTILQDISLSEITGNTLDANTSVKIVKPEYVNEIFQITSLPQDTTKVNQNGSSSVVSVQNPIIIVASDVNFISQTATFTAYSWNSLTNSYDIMPRSGSSNFNGINNSIFAGFSAMADWILPIVIAIPIVLVALIIGLGCAIGIPMSKHKKSIKVGFEMQHQKVNTLTTAVGGVFKKIIDNTSAANMKAKPQMLKAGGSAPAKPAAAPGPKPAGGPAPKPAASAAGPKPAAAPGPKPAGGPAAPK